MACRSIFTSVSFPKLNRNNNWIAPFLWREPTTLWSGRTAIGCPKRLATFGNLTVVPGQLRLPTSCMAYGGPNWERSVEGYLWPLPPGFPNSSPSTAVEAIDTYIDLFSSHMWTINLIPELIHCIVSIKTFDLCLNQYGGGRPSKENNSFELHLQI